MKHKHADLIIAWANGAEIQYFDDDLQQWVDEKPEWHDDFKYRIKPEEKKPVVRWLWAYQHPLSACELYKQTNHFYTEQEIMSDQVGKLQPIKLEWSRTEFPE